MRSNIAFFFFFLITFGVSAQDNDSTQTVNTIDNQFQELKGKSGTFKSYKVIKENELDAFWTTVLDSIGNVKQDLADSKNEINSQQAEIQNLNNTIKSKDEVIAEKEYGVSHIEVLGIDMDKGAYKVTNFIIIGILIIGLAVLIFKFKDNNRIAKKKTQDYDRLNDEFEEYKRNALEKQMKLRRDLQTERNKLENIRSN